MGNASVNTEWVDAKPSSRRGRVVIVDDSAELLMIMNGLLQDRYDTMLAKDGESALRIAARGRTDLILLDIMMPGMDGFEVCRRLKADPATAGIPVIFLTSKDDTYHETRAFQQGAVDYITKPITPETLRARVETHVSLSQSTAYLKDQNRYLEDLVAERTAEIASLRDATILAMASLAEFRSSETGNHLRRTAHYVAALANRVKDRAEFAEELTPANIHLLFKSAPLHDIGKVGIPDQILLKPGKLTEAEFEVMKRHTAIGRDAIHAVRRELGSENGFLRYAAQIAYAHHEKYDGSGYPEGLAGEAIPLSARLMAVADVYDALISRRVYKAPYAHEDAVAYLRAGSGTHFDPVLIDTAISMQDEFARIASRFPDEYA